MEQNRIIETAQKAFDNLARGWSTGDFQSYINMLSDDVVLWLPVGKQRSQPFGYEGKEQIIARLRSHQQAGDQVIFSPPDHVTSNDTTVTFEFESQGTIRNQPFKGRSAISFDVKNDQIYGVREYFGDIG
ncbi:MAG: nuclear transport factor 2 family protein [Desmonostoc vinosum HA7617-LM4]|jgi:ketosteroid isomerase-like protein|nr:nuclear transport factor 2 family protein [Desmonostoc vinosum HA7617-LM4]